jgi:hypothetical protein
MEWWWPVLFYAANIVLMRRVLPRLGGPTEWPTRDVSSLDRMTIDLSEGRASQFMSEERRRLTCRNQ